MATWSSSQKRTERRWPHWIEESPAHSSFLTNPTLIPLFVPSCQQIRPHQLVQIPIEHAVHVADLLARAQVFHHSIRLQNVRADLRAEIDVEFGILDVFADGLLLLQLEFVDARAENAHRLFFVLVLRALVLAGYD